MNSPIEERLLSELKTRNFKLIPPHVLTIAVAAWCLKPMDVFYPFFIIGISLVLRVLWIKKMTRVTIPYLSFMGLTGLGWGLVSYYTYRYYGLYSAETIGVLGVMVILMSGGVTAFSPSMKVATTFFLSLTIIPAFILFTHSGESTYILGILLLINFLYCVYHAGVSHKLMKHLFEIESEATSRRNTLQEFLNAIPGLVAVIDRNEKFLLVNNHFDHSLEIEIKKMLGEFMKSADHEFVREVQFGDNWYMVNLKRIQSQEASIVAAIHPINELIKARNDLRIQESRAQYTAKLASLGEFSASIAHEVNNPLTIIEGSVSLIKVFLEDKEVDKEGLIKASNKISETTLRIAKIIKSLRTLSGNAEEEPFTNVTFQSIVEPALEICRPKLQLYNIKLNVSKPSELIDLFGNEVQLSQVMMNLISNAIDAVKEINGERWIEIQYKAFPECIDILVLDSGKGVPAEFREKIMEPFFTTKVSHQGTGLGLSISKSIIESHQGKFSLISDAPHTTFRMRFPRMNPWIKRTELLGVSDVVPG